MLNKWIYINQGRRSLYGFGILSTIILTSGNVYFIIQNPHFIPYALFFGFTTLYLSLSYFVGIVSNEFDSKSYLQGLPNHPPEVEIDVFLPICGEPYELLEKTWQSTSQIAGFPKFYVLDDSPVKDPRVKALALEYGFQYITRPDNSLKKAGNLRHAFARTTSPFILILDADFAPHWDILRMTHSLMKDPKVAIVQTPQFFEISKRQSWISNAAASIQELFYRLIQVNRDHFNGAICVGTNALYRRSALEPFGGTAPIQYSEDVHTGFQLISSGWKIKYIPIINAVGICPETVKQYFTQQYRWALGSISLFFSKKFWKANITLGQRVCYLTGMFFYMTTGLSLLFGPMPSLVMLIFYPEKIFWFNLLFSVPSLLYSTVFMFYWMRLPMNIDVLTARHISYFSHLFALRDYLLNSLEEWKPTGAKTSSNRYESFKKWYYINFIYSVILPFGLVIYRVNGGYELNNFLLLLFFLGFSAMVQLKRSILD